jgi:hypothetical protein
MENLRAKYPDNDFSNEDSYYEVSMKGYDSLRDESNSRAKKYEEDNKFIHERLSANPEVFACISAILAGDSIPKAMAHLKDVINLEEGTPEYEEYMNEVNVRNERDAKANKDYEEFEANKKASAEALKAFADKNGLTEEEMVTFIEEVINMLREKIFSGKFDEEFFEKFYRVFNYDKEMEMAMEAGRIAGRNEKIEMKNKKRNGTDGLPTTTASAGGMESRKPNPREEMVLSLASRNKENERFK